MTRVHPLHLVRVRLGVRTTLIHSLALVVCRIASFAHESGFVRKERLGRVCRVMDSVWGRALEKVKKEKEKEKEREGEGELHGFCLWG